MLLIFTLVTHAHCLHQLRIHHESLLWPFGSSDALYKAPAVAPSRGPGSRFVRPRRLRACSPAVPAEGVEVSRPTRPCLRLRPRPNWPSPRSAAAGPDGATSCIVKHRCVRESEVFIVDPYVGLFRELYCSALLSAIKHGCYYGP